MIHRGILLEFALPQESFEIRLTELVSSSGKAATEFNAVET
jgi:hypothetical protein